MSKKKPLVVTAPKNLAELSELVERRRDHGWLLPGSFAKLRLGQELLRTRGSHLWMEAEARKSAARASRYQVRGRY